MIKIGFTGKPVQHRFAALISGSPVPLELVAWGHGGRPFERAFHERFAAHWSHGEWFHYSAEVGAAVRLIGMGGHCATHINPDEYPRGIFIAHVLHGHDSERVRCMDPNYVPKWVREQYAYDGRYE